MGQKGKWTCTDPDNLQYAIKTHANTWMFREFDRVHYQQMYEELRNKKSNWLGVWNNENYWIEDEVNLDNYDEHAMYKHICHYYPWDEFQELLADSPEVIAECIFEQEKGMY